MSSQWLVTTRGSSEGLWQYSHCWCCRVQFQRSEENAEWGWNRHKLFTSLSTSFVGSLTTPVASTSDLGFSFLFLNVGYLLATNLSWYYNLLHTTDSQGAGPFSQVWPVLRREVTSSMATPQSSREWGPRLESRILTKAEASRQPLWDLGISLSAQEVQMPTCSWPFACISLCLWQPTHTAGCIAPLCLRVVISTAKATSRNHFLWKFC